MAEALEHIGRRCEHEHCGQKDFLPIACDRCKLHFCQEHILRHPCVAEEQEQKTFTKYKREKCQNPTVKCNERAMPDWECSHCQLRLCPSHRVPKDHACSILAVEAETKMAAKRHKDKVEKRQSQVKSKAALKSARKLMNDNPTAKKLLNMKIRSKAKVLGKALDALSPNPVNLVVARLVDGTDVVEAVQSVVAPGGWTIGKLLDTAGPLLRFTVQNHDPSKPRIDAFQVNCRANVQPSIESAIDAVEESVEEGVSATCPTSTLTAGSDDGCAVGDVQTIPVSPLNPATLLSTLQPQPLILVLGHLGPSTLDALPDIHLASLSLL
eukprot:m.99706 g.99706  ORF g.99706 m.99706 type:complete len:325 (+) comp13149_c0_seq5:52-1026(+)